MTSVEVHYRTAHVKFADHPTCGHFTWKYPRHFTFQLNEKPTPKGVARR